MPMPFLATPRTASIWPQSNLKQDLVRAETVLYLLTGKRNEMARAQPTVAFGIG